MPMVGRHCAMSLIIKETRQIGRNLNSSSRQSYRALGTRWSEIDR